MGQAQSRDAGRAAAAQGWPAYMSQARLKRAMLRFPADRSLLGTRVRLRQSGGGWIEYSRVPGQRPGQQPLYRRVDGGPRGDEFPEHLAAWELPAGEDVPHEVSSLAPDRVSLRDRAGSAQYSLSGGTWARIGRAPQKKVWPPW